MDDLSLTLPGLKFWPNPTICPVTYSCDCKDVGGNPCPNDLACDTPGVTTFNTEDSTLTLEMGITAYTTYPPGQYVFTVYGSVGSEVATAKTQQQEYIISFVDLCAIPPADGGVQMVLNPSPLVDMVYVLDEDSVTQLITTSSLYYLEPDIDCGKPLIEVYSQFDDAAGTTLLDGQFAFEGSLNDDVRPFSIRKTNNKDDIKMYDIYYKLRYPSYTDPAIFPNSGLQADYRLDYPGTADGPVAFSIEIQDIVLDCTTEV